MHMMVKNTLYLFILSPIIPYPYLFWVEGLGGANTPACFPHHPETPQAKNSMTLKIHL